MRRAKILAAVALLALLSQPALAEPRWLACKYNDTSGKPQTFHMVFDDLRGTAAILDNGGLIDGTGTTVNFPAFNLTYNRNDGALAVSATGGLGGILTGECRRSAPPPGAPQLPQ